MNGKPYYERPYIGISQNITKRAREQARQAEKARQEVEKARQEAERQARQESERQARQEAERQARERQARQESERQARQDAREQAKQTTQTTKSSTPLEILGININEYNKLNHTAKQALIKKQYRKLALERHPNKGGTPEAFQELGKAYNALKSGGGKRKLKTRKHRK